jgi:hypothetical protein
LNTVLWTSVVAGVLGVAGAAGAQESLLPLPLEKTSVAVALEKATREHRILVVVREWKRPPQGRRPWWANDSVRAWLTWHAVLVQVNPEDSEGRNYFRGVPRDDSNKFWGVDVFVDGERTRLLKCTLPFTIASMCRNDPCDPVASTGPDDWGSGPCVAPTGTAMLGQLDLQLECGNERDALWRELHKLDCPEPVRPGRRYWYGAEEDGLPRTSDIAEPTKGDRYVDVFARIKEADALAAAGNRGAALALLEWAWERGGDVDPGFALARVGVVLPRLIDLRLTDPAVAKRIGQMADAELALYPWFDDPEELGYLCLRWAGDEKERVEERLVVENVDLDEETMGGIVAARLGEIKARITEQSLNVPIEPKRWKELLKAAQLKVPRLIDPEPKKRWQQRHIELLTIGAVRQYGLLLSSDDPAERARGEKLAEDVLKEAEKSEPALRAAVLRAMAFGAASVGKAGETQRGWLAEAAKINPPVEGKDKGSVDPLSRAIGEAGKK